MPVPHVAPPEPDDSGETGENKTHLNLGGGGGGPDGAEDGPGGGNAPAPQNKAPAPGTRVVHHGHRPNHAAMRNMHSAASRHPELALSAAPPAPGVRREPDHHHDDQPKKHDHAALAIAQQATHSHVHHGHNSHALKQAMHMRPGHM